MTSFESSSCWSDAPSSGLGPPLRIGRRTASRCAPPPIARKRRWWSTSWAARPAAPSSCGWTTAWATAPSTRSTRRGSMRPAFPSGRRTAFASATFASITGNPPRSRTGFGGVFIAYSQSPEPTVDRDLYMQHVDGSGTVLWGNGVDLGGDPDEGAPALIGDGISTQIASPERSSRGPTSPRRRRRQHLRAARGCLRQRAVGRRRRGVRVAGNQSQPAMITDGVGTIFTTQGVIITWTDMRTDKKRRHLRPASQQRGRGAVAG